MNSHYIYLHGFASSPRSAKARYLGAIFSQLNLNLHILDLNQDDFSHLTLTRQIKQTAAAFPSLSTPVTIIGSSFGGLTAAWLGEKYSQVQRLVLLAPAFGFLNFWEAKLGRETIQKWENYGYLQVYHHGEKRELSLHYQFLKDLREYNEQALLKSIPTLIIHGVKDDVIPIEFSCNYAANRPWVKLIKLSSDHSLGDSLTTISHAIKEFCF